MIRRRILSMFAVSAMAAGTSGTMYGFQQRPAPPPSSHEVHADGTITFRYKDAGATKVNVLTDAALKPLAMQRGEDGMWSVTTQPLPPSIYGYTIVADGVPMLDPRNLQVRHNLVSPSSEVTVPAQPPAPWELTDITHGTVSRHVMTTHIAKNLPQNQTAYIVYTPPGYDPKRKGGYPMLYLLHGFTDGEDGWTSVGRANLILDSMIDGGKAVPMIVVMPLGYGDFKFLLGGFAGWNNADAVNGNVSLFGETLEREVMPAVEREYNVAAGRDNRAIAGLSMGGLESLMIGLKHTDQFAYIAGFSSAILHMDFDGQLPDLDAKKTNLRLLWVGCGVDDGLIDANRTFVTWAKGKGLPVTPVETPGAHTWLVWRDNLLHVAPMLFRK